MVFKDHSILQCRDYYLIMDYNHDIRLLLFFIFLFDAWLIWAWPIRRRVATQHESSWCCIQVIFPAVSAYSRTVSRTSYTKQFSQLRIRTSNYAVTRTVSNTCDTELYSQLCIRVSNYAVTRTVSNKCLLLMLSAADADKGSWLNHFAFLCDNIFVTLIYFSFLCNFGISIPQIPISVWIT